MEQYEPAITIEGHLLTEAQAMAVRVAIIAFSAEMQDPDALGDDVHGRRMTKQYCARLIEVIALMAKEQQ